MSDLHEYFVGLLYGATVGFSNRFESAWEDYELGLRSELWKGYDETRDRAGVDTRRRMEALNARLPVHSHNFHPGYVGFWVATSDPRMARERKIPCLKAFAAPVQELAERYTAEVEAAREAWAAWETFARARNQRYVPRLMLVSDRRW